MYNVTLQPNEIIVVTDHFNLWLISTSKKVLTKNSLLKIRLPYLAFMPSPDQNSLIKGRQKDSYPYSACKRKRHSIIGTSLNQPFHVK